MNPWQDRHTVEGVRNGKGPRPDSEYFACERCGAKYDMDTVVTDAEWEAITGRKDGSGYYCPWCLDDLAVEKGIKCNAVLYFTGYAISAVSDAWIILEANRRLRSTLEQLICHR